MSNPCARGHRKIGIAYDEIEVAELIKALQELPADTVLRRAWTDDCRGEICLLLESNSFAYVAPGNEAERFVL